MWDIFIDNGYYDTYILELIAVASGLFYLYGRKVTAPDVKLLVFLLIFVFVYDLTSITWALYGYVYDYEHVEFIKGTAFEGFYWIYNSCQVIAASLYSLYFVMQLRTRRYRRIILWLMAIYCISAVGSFFVGEEFLSTTASYPYIVGSFLICFSIGVYYLEFVKSSRILKFKTELPLYVSIGLLISLLVMPPLFIYQKFIGGNDLFRTVFRIVHTTSNIIRYLGFSLGFLMMYMNTDGKPVTQREN